MYIIAFFCLPFKTNKQNFVYFLTQENRRRVRTRVGDRDRQDSHVCSSSGDARGRPSVVGEIGFRKGGRRDENYLWWECDGKELQGTLCVCFFLLVRSEHVDELLTIRILENS